MQVACIGNVVYDLIVSSEKFSIVEGIRNSFSDAVCSAGGPASNAASVISKFGTSVDFYGRIGKDAMGEYVSKKMRLENIDLVHLTKSDKIMTPFSFVILNQEKRTRTIFTVRSKTDYNKPKLDAENYKTGYDFILTDGKFVKDTLKLMKANPKATTIIDAGRVNDGVVRLCNVVDYIICSEEFAKGVTGEEITGDYENDAKVYRKMQAIFKNALGIVITVGKKGYICEQANRVVVNPSYNTGLVAIDTNGAGDIFHGAFTSALAKGYDYYDALEFANITASLSTTKPGGRDSCPELSQVEKILEKQKKKTLTKKIR